MTTKSKFNFLTSPTRVFIILVLVFAAFASQAHHQVSAAPSYAWTAYNDCQFVSTAPSDLAGNITQFRCHTASANNMLVKYADGTPTGVTVDIATNDTIVQQVSSTDRGAIPTGGDAVTVFNPFVTMRGGNKLENAPSTITLTFKLLDPAKTYTFATSANRAGGDTYAARHTTFTLSDLDGATNTSSAGTTASGYVTSFSTGENTEAGYIARWEGINPGADGDFRVTFSVTTGSDGYGPAVFLLSEEGEVEPPEESWTAYNDCQYVADAPADLTAKITQYRCHTASAGNVLHRYSDGAAIAATVDVAVSGEVIQQITGQMGAVPTGGDAVTVFNPFVTMRGGENLNTAPATVTLTFKHLDPTQTYTFATSANRAGGDTYLVRETTFTISDVDGATNTSSAGTSASGYTTTFSTGENTATGYIARWAGIQPGADGDFVVTSSVTTGTEAYGPAVFLLSQEGEVVPAYTLDVVSDHGTVVKNPDKPTYANGEAVQLTSTADVGWDFASWSGGLTSVNNPDTVIISGNTTVTANYSQVEYLLTITSDHGTVAKSPDQPTYHYGELILLTATPDPGWSFESWSVGLVSTTNPDSVFMDGNTQVTANYVQSEYTLDITSANGIVTKNPDQLVYHYGDVVQLTAAPAAGYLFLNWSGDLTGTTNPDSITMDGNKSVEAVYEYQNPLPVLTGIFPNHKWAGRPGLVLKVFGGQFSPNSVVRFNGSDRVTTYFNVGKLTANLTAADLLTASVNSITVYTPGPGGGESSPQVFTVVNDIPVINTLAPTSKIHGKPAFILTVFGKKFGTGAVVRWNGVDRPTTWINQGKITAIISADDIAFAGTASITVYNPAPGEGLSNSVTFFIN
jgi:hypothetical protein